MRSSTVLTTRPSCSHGRACPPWRVPPCPPVGRTRPVASPVPTQLRRLDIARRLQVLICLTSLAWLATASGQLAPIRKPPFTDRLETVRQYSIRLPGGRLGLYHRRRRTLDVPRCLGK